MTLAKVNYDHIVKTPHLFLVTFKERYTSINADITSGKAWTKFCDGVAVNVYGFKDEAEAEAFDPLRLRGYLTPLRTKKILWPSQSKELLLAEIAKDEMFKNGAHKLSETAQYGAIENLPECSRMHSNTQNGQILCGKPENEHSDGCLGGCVLQGYDQEFDPEHFICPVQDYWEKRQKKS